MMMDREKLTKALAKEQPPRPITIEEAIDRLDLTPFDQFVPPANAPEGRATGQTTKMLVEAVVRSQYEPVTIRAYTHRYARYLIRDARLMAARLGLDPNRIGETGYVFTDHYLGRDTAP